MSREVLLWGPEIPVATAEADIDGLQAQPWGWRDGPIDAGTTPAYDQWWALHRLTPLTDLGQPAPVEWRVRGPRGRRGRGGGRGGRGG